MTIYVGPYTNLIHRGAAKNGEGHGSPMMHFNRLKLFDKNSFGEQFLNLYAIDTESSSNEKCSGKHGLPKLNPSNEGLYMYHHMDLDPIKLGEDEPTFWHWKDHMDVMRMICRVDVDIKMLWNKCSFFLVSMAQEPALIMITENKVLDP